MRRALVLAISLGWAFIDGLHARGIVFLSEDRTSLNGLKIIEDGVRRQWNAALFGLTATSSFEKAWRRLGIYASDHVGIKISTAGGKLSGTRVELVNAVIMSLRSAGITRITVWDKWRREMEWAGYFPNSGQVLARTLALLPAPPGMSKRHFLDYPLVGRLLPDDVDFLWEFQRERLDPNKFSDRKRFLDLRSGTSRRSYFGKPIVEEFTKIINIASLTDHDQFGIHGCMVSLALGSVDNTLRFAQRNRGAGEAIGEILDHNILKSRVKLHVIDGLRVQYASGPRQEAEFVRPAGILFLSEDPVAVDTLGLEILDEYRKRFGFLSVDKMAGHIFASAEIGLGEARREKIQVRR